MPKSPRSHVTGHADFDKKTIYNTTNQEEQAMTRLQQQLSQDTLIEAEKEVTKPYAHNLLISEKLSKCEKIGDHNEFI